MSASWEQIKAAVRLELENAASEEPEIVPEPVAKSEPAKVETPTEDLEPLDSRYTLDKLEIPAPEHMELIDYCDFGYTYRETMDCFILYLNGARLGYTPAMVKLANLCFWARSELENAEKVGNQWLDRARALNAVGVKAVEAEYQYLGFGCPKDELMAKERLFAYCDSKADEPLAAETISKLMEFEGMELSDEEMLDYLDSIRSIDFSANRTKYPGLVTHNPDDIHDYFKFEAEVYAESNGYKINEELAQKHEWYETMMHLICIRYLHETAILNHS